MGLRRGYQHDKAVMAVNVCPRARLMTGAGVTRIVHRHVRRGAGVLIPLIRQTAVGVNPYAGQGAEEIDKDDQR